MSKGFAGKNNWALALLILIGVVIGGLLGQMASTTPALSFLNYGQTFGFTSPIVLDLGILVLTFALSIHITVAGIIGVVIAIIIYRFL